MRCPRCDLALETCNPIVGDVWVHTRDGVLYRVTAPPRQERNYWVADRIFPEGPQGCDSLSKLAMWPADINAGDWLRIKDYEEASQQHSGGDP